MASGKIILLSKQFLNSLTILKWKLTAMKLSAVFFLTYLKPLILSIIRSYYRNYTDTGSVMSLSSGFESWTQYVEVENVKSNPLSIQFGVPQGSILGPLLFLICINDIPNCLEKANIRTFTDDPMHSILLFQFSTGPWKTII